MNLKEKLQVNNSQLAILCFAVILTVFGIVETILHLGADVPTSKKMFMCASYILILYYALYGYKKPHGNLLKYTIWFFVLLLINGAALGAGGQFQTPADLSRQAIQFSGMATTFSIAVISYLSGRLNRFKKTVYLFACVLILLLIRSVLMVQYRTLMWANLSDAIVWLDIFCAYVLRYKQHREAGLES